MDLPWGDEKTRKFITNVGLVTSNGPHGENIMAVEWTHHISYSPGLIAINLGPGKASIDNIRETKKFGVNLCADDQAVASSVSGGYTGREYDKIAALKEMGFKFYQGDGIPMVEDAALNLECKLVNEIPLGSHTMFVGEVTAAKLSDKKPLALHGGKYWYMDRPIERTSDEEREKNAAIVEKHKKS